MSRRLPMIFLALSLTACSSSQQALKLINKQKYQAAQEKIDKALAKDSLHADLLYVYSLLYTDTAFASYDIDTAHFFILASIEDFTRSDAKKRSKYFKAISLDSTALLQQKQRIDSLAFLKFKNINTVTAYQQFVEEYPDASQRQEAESLRNELAYEAALEQDTYQAYQAFMEAYPEAKQYEQAKERYNTLVFKASTWQGNLQSYLDFLASFPKSPYRANAEKQILEISTADNQLSAYLDFIRQYPQSPHLRLAINQFYHLYKEKYGAEAFFSEYAELAWVDSLKKAYEASAQVFAPVFEDNKYGLINSQGTYAINTDYDLIPEDYLCEGVTEDLVHLGIQDGNRIRHQLLDKSGAKVYSFDTEMTTFEQDEGILRQKLIYHLPAGLLLIRQEEGTYQLMQQAGILLMPDQTIDTLELVPAVSKASENAAPFQFIKFAQNGRWGLATFNGRVLLEANYSEIEAYEEFITLSQEGSIAVTNRSSVAAIADQRPLELSFLYEDVALMDDRFLVAYTDKYETVLDENLDIAVPSDRHTIVRSFKGDNPQEKLWLLRKDDFEAYVSNDSLLNRRISTYYLYQKEQADSQITYRDVYYSNDWLALKHDQGFMFYDFSTTGVPQAGEPQAGKPLAYDSVKLIGDSFALLFKESTTGTDSVTIRYKTGRSDTMSPADELNFLLLNAGAGSQRQEYLLIAPRQGKKEIRSVNGELVLQDDFTDVKVYDHGLFVIEQKNRKGLLNHEGKTLLPFRYEAISNYKDGLLALFRNKKFGTYHHATKTLIEPAYESVLQAYGEAVLNLSDSVLSELFIARKEGALGLINQKNEPLAAFAFDEISYWNDTSALVRQANEWALIRIPRFGKYEKEHDYVLYSGIDDFSIVEEEGGEKVLKIYKEGGYGIISNRKGELLGPTYDDIRLLGSVNDVQSLYMAEKYVPEADLYIVIHIDTSGKIIKRQALTPEQYDNVFCEN
ncbi:MAG: WG repeat-containing protein [Cyclobacteriaceae bacterium]